MLRILFVSILLSHGLIHLTGFAKAFKLAEVSQLTGTFTRTAGVFWLLTAVLFSLAMLLFWLKKDSWWILAVPAVVVSQVLIFSQWQDAKFGTIANIIAVVGIVLAYGQWQWNGRIRQEMQSFIPAALPESSVLTKEMVAGLPPVVQQWLERSQVIGKKMTRQVHLHQTGKMRTRPDGKWMDVEAEQYFTVHQPGFIWIADVKAAPLIHLKGRDMYQNGKGDMLIKALALIPVASARGKETDQASMLRYLAEICWFPSAALNTFIQWEPLNAHSAKATMRYGEMEGSGIFNFDANGDLLSFDALRYYDKKNGATLEKWHIENHPDSFKTFEGIRIPTRSSVTWQLPDGDFTWFELEVSGLEYL